ncbi:glycine zipper 2TM domain-containing protein [Seohaeicola saemankumensis]|uniref:17 kDa surface antigen n=1 Tax=Seohaeicola saemankumensis TaxID=481181 RepID=A0ABW3T8C4_9RHOB
MKRNVLSLVSIACLAVAGCETMTREEQMVVGGLTGATVGLVTANAFDANTNWKIIAVLAGAAAGTLVARNNATAQCAYAVGNGTYRILPCP